MRFDSHAIERFARELLEHAGMPVDFASAVAGILVEGDLLGHDTHGLQLLPEYLAEIEAGGLSIAGRYSVLSDRGAALAWDGHRLPGPWLVLQAIEIASERARRFGTCTVSIRHSHHIACLATYARRVAEDGLLLLLYSSSPSGASVAPFGGTRALFSPSPIAVGFPTGADPVMVDVSTSITTNGMTGRLLREGGHLPGQWLIDEHGVPTDDPAVVISPRTGTILPLGGMDAGHKGYGLALMVEALTAGLAGHGRSQPGRRLGATVLVQVIDPNAFNGLDAFTGQMDWIADACRNNPPRSQEQPVRLPGERGQAMRASYVRDGVPVPDAVIALLQAWAQKLNAPPLPEGRPEP